MNTHNPDNFPTPRQAIAAAESVGADLTWTIAGPYLSEASAEELAALVWIAEWIADDCPGYVDAADAAYNAARLTDRELRVEVAKCRGAMHFGPYGGDNPYNWQIWQREVVREMTRRFRSI